MNPLIPQFWLFGLDSENGDLQARGFQQRPYPNTKSSLYVLNGLCLHANGLWLEQHSLYYHRGSEQFFRCDQPEFSLRPPDLIRLEFQSGLHSIHALICEHERFISHRRGLEHRAQPLGPTVPSGVRRTWNAWTEWIQTPAPSPEARTDHSVQQSRQSQHQLEPNYGSHRHRIN